MIDQKQDRFWTVSNGFSLLRLVLTVPVVWFIALGSDYVWLTFGLVVVMIVSDFLDGYFARLRHEITRWGKILDPLADKVAIGAITVAMVLYKGFPLWLVALVLGRDGLIVLASLFLIGRRDVVVSSNIWGKLTTLMMSLLLVCYLLDIEVAKPSMIWVCSGLLVISWASYLLNFIHYLRES